MPVQPHILERLLHDAQGAVLMDGGMGSTIEDRGVDVANAMWGSRCFVDETGRDINRVIHEDFVRAGARLLIANTHNILFASCDAFCAEAPELLPEDVRVSARPGSALHAWLHKQAVDAVAEATGMDETIAIASCLGSIEPLGPYAAESKLTVDQATALLEAELRARMDTGVDLVIFETLTTRTELTALAKVCHRHNHVPCAMGLTCGANGKTLGGVTMAECVEIFGETPPVAWFIQCTRYDYVPAALADLIGAADAVPSGVYANDGRVWEDSRWHGERMTPEDYAEAAALWQDMGAQIIGGCCGTTPAHIAAIRDRLAG